MAPLHNKPSYPAKAGVSSTPRLLDSIINGSGILDHPLSRMMTAGGLLRIQNFKQRHSSQTSLRDLAALCARVIQQSFALGDQRAQGMPGARSARSLACKVESTRVSHHGHAGSPGIPRAMVLTVSFALSPVTGLIATVASRVASADLTPASGRQDHTTSPSASSAVRLKRRQRPPHPASRS